MNWKSEDETEVWGGETERGSWPLEQESQGLSTERQVHLPSLGMEGTLCRTLLGAPNTPDLRGDTKSMGGRRRWDPAHERPRSTEKSAGYTETVSWQGFRVGGRTWDADWILASGKCWTPMGAAKVKMFRLTGVCQGRNQGCPWEDAPGGVYLQGRGLTQAGSECEGQGSA